jgi:hypothetical protein
LGENSGGTGQTLPKDLCNTNGRIAAVREIIKLLNQINEKSPKKPGPKLQNPVLNGNIAARFQETSTLTHSGQV